MLLFVPFKFLYEILLRMQTDRARSGKGDERWIVAKEAQNCEINITLHAHLCVVLEISWCSFLSLIYIIQSYRSLSFWVFSIQKYSFLYVYVCILASSHIVDTSTKNVIQWFFLFRRKTSLISGIWMNILNIFGLKDLFHG